MLVILFFHLIQNPKHNQFIVATAQNIYLLTFSASLTLPALIIHLCSLFLQFYKSNYKHPGYNLEIKEADSQLVPFILTS